jgi:hypothetical protein
MQQLSTLSNKGFKKLQQEWYEKLASAGFTDIEDHTRGGFEISEDGERISPEDGGRPLIRWTGIAIDESKIESPLHKAFEREERLLRSVERRLVCLSVSSHWNCRLGAMGVLKLLILRCQGKSNRAIAIRLKISEFAVRTYLHKIGVWMDLL